MVFALITGKLLIESKIASVKNEHRVTALITGQLQTETKINLVKYIKQMVCLNHLSATN